MADQINVIQLDKPVRFTFMNGREVREGTIRHISRNLRGEWGLFVDHHTDGGFWVSFDQVQQ